MAAMNRDKNSNVGKVDSPRFGKKSRFPKIPPINIKPLTPEPPGLNLTPHLTIRDQEYKCDRAEDLQSMGLIGRGAYGVVEKHLHKPSDTLMAVKRIAYNTNSEEQKKQLLELDVSMRSGSCLYTVTSYGSLFRSGDVWICMELMDTSLDKFYLAVNKLNGSLPEPIIGQIAFSMVSALHYLKSELNVIHRDVKPSNMLINRRGQVKLCDFGISGVLVDSMARTNLGSRPYMAPERIDPPEPGQSFSIKADVWSLGISLQELALGKFPYKAWRNLFEQLSEVVRGPAPQLPEGKFSHDFVNLINCCLQKAVDDRHNYPQLLEHPFLVTASNADTDVAKYVNEILDSGSDSATDPPQN